MTTTCINLRERFGQRFKIAFEESYLADRGAGARADDPWLQIIPGRRGHVFPHGGDLLAASTRGRGPTATKLKALPGVKVWQDGSDGITVLFAPDLLDQVAELLLLKRRRRVNDRERARLAGMSRQYGFRPREHIVDVSSEARPCVPLTPVV